MWTDKNINLIDKVPDFFAEIYEYQTLFEVLDSELELLKENMNNYSNNLFLSTADESILTRYQNILKTSGETDEEKRENIVAKFSETVPFGLNSLKSVVDRHINGDCSLYQATGKIYAYYESDTYIEDTTALMYDVYNIIPANLQFYISYLYAKYSKYSSNIYSELAQKTWQDLKLGH